MIAQLPPIPTSPISVHTYMIPTLHSLQVAHLKGRYRCITTDLPGFGDGGNEHNHADVEAEKNGYSIDEIVARLERTVEEAGEGSPVTIVAHDWGW